MGILGYDALNDSFSVNYELIGRKVYKLLPIFEGKVRDSEEKVDKDIALSNFFKNLDVLTTEIRGVLSKVVFHQNLSEVYIALEGLKGIDKTEHETVRSVVLHCVNLLNAIGG